MAKVKEEVEHVEIPRTPLVLKVECGSCMFLNTAGAYANSKGDVTCASLGTVPSSTPCRLYTPDPKKVKGGLGAHLRILMEVDQPQVLAAALVSKLRVKRLGYSLGQEVYFHVLGGDYVCNYASGIVVGGIHKMVIIEGVGGCTACYKPESLMSFEDWSVKLGKLLGADRINDPNGGIRRVGKDVVTLRYLPPPHSRKVPPPSKKRGRKRRSDAAISLS